MTIEELRSELKDIVRSQEGDVVTGEISFETDHVLADELLIGYIGDEEVAKLFKTIKKWYS